MHKKNLNYAGEPLDTAKKAMIMIHGRGANADDILGLAPHLHVNGFALIAPDATNNTWYPYSFLAPVRDNEPWLSSALSLLQEVVDDLLKAGFASRHIYFLGFSQGACLTLEFAARNARRYGGIIAFTGGLIGESIAAENYAGNFEGTPVFIGSGDPDPHIPVSRVDDSAAIIRSMGAAVTKKIYPGMGHNVSQDEIRMVNELIFRDSL